MEDVLNFTSDGYLWQTEYDIVNLKNSKWEKVIHCFLLCDNGISPTFALVVAEVIARIQRKVTLFKTTFCTDSQLQYL